MTTIIKTAFVPEIAAESFAPTTDEANILAIPSITGWYEATHGVEQTNGFRWRDRLDGRKAALLNIVKPIVTTGSNSRPTIQMGYGKTEFSGTEKGMLRPPSEVPLISTTGFTIFSVTRVPTVASGESATLGGYVWSSRGTAGNQTPGLNISGSTGRPTFRAGGAVIVNPAGFDARTGNWHLMRCVWDASTISINIDRARATGSNTGATTAPDSSVTNMLSPLIGCYLNSANNAVTSPFHGQVSAVLFFDGVLTSPQIVTVENYLATKYGVTLV